MISNSPHPYSGRHAAGFRFCFHVRAISHRSLFLPLEMKQDPHIQRLLKGESPLSVFGCDCIHSARRKFCELRKQYDFPYWAVKEYFIRDIQDADLIVPLNLNLVQHYLADLILRRHYNRDLGRYVITKTCGRVGLTTCIQAYMLWRQTFWFWSHSYTCSSRDINLNPLKTDLCRQLHRDIVPPDKFIYIPQADRSAFFNTYRSPDFIRGIDIGFLHLADMSKWHDEDGELSRQVYTASSSSVLLRYDTLVVLEGNIPKKDRFNILDHIDRNLPRDYRMAQLGMCTKNPFFLNEVLAANSRTHTPIFLHIDLDHSLSSTKSIDIPHPLQS